MYDSTYIFPNLLLYDDNIRRLYKRLYQLDYYKNLNFLFDK